MDWKIEKIDYKHPPGEPGIDRNYMRVYVTHPKTHAYKDIKNVNDDPAFDQYPEADLIRLIVFEEVGNDTGFETEPVTTDIYYVDSDQEKKTAHFIVKTENGDEAKAYAKSKKEVNDAVGGPSSSGY